uniref:Gonadoliberin n=1 Tax=Podarcis muralis TaxID=64176 RepID=A0A670JHA2_PODMU
MEEWRRLGCCLPVPSCSAQHWSYGLQPGGKGISHEVLLQEIAPPHVPFHSFSFSATQITNELGKLGKLQYFDCNVPRQRPIFRSLKAALVSIFPPPFLSFPGVLTASTDKRFLLLANPTKSTKNHPTKSTKKRETTLQRIDNHGFLF